MVREEAYQYIKTPNRRDQTKDLQFGYLSFGECDTKLSAQSCRQELVRWARTAPYASGFWRELASQQFAAKPRAAFTKVGQMASEILPRLYQQVSLPLYTTPQ